MFDESYISIQGWMRTKLELEKCELFAYAIVYGFSQDGVSEYKGSTSYVCKWYGCSKPTAAKALESLEAKGLIIKRQETVSKVVFNRFRANPAFFKGGKDSLRGGSKETLQGGGKDSLPSNTIISNTTKETKRVAEFLPPSQKEIAQFMFDYMKKRDAFSSFKHPAYWAKYMAEEYTEHFSSNKWRSGGKRLSSIDRTAQRWVRQEEKRGTMKRCPPNHKDYSKAPWENKEEEGVPTDYVSPLQRR